MYVILGTQPTTTNYRQEDSHTEERIAQILSEAQLAMQAKQSHEKVSTTRCESSVSFSYKKRDSILSYIPHCFVSSSAKHSSDLLYKDLFIGSLIRFKVVGVWALPLSVPCRRKGNKSILMRNAKILSGISSESSTIFPYLKVMSPEVQTLLYYHNVSIIKWKPKKKHSVLSL